MQQQQRWLQAWEYCQAKLIQTLVRASQGVDWSWSQCIKSHHAQTHSGKGLPSHFWTRDNVRRHLTWAVEKNKLSGPKSSFQMKVNFAFHLKQGPRVWRKSGEGTYSIVAWSPVWSFHSQRWFWAATSSPGVGALCFLKSTFNAAILPEILEHFMLPSADKLYGDADFIFQQDLAPATLPKVPKAGSMTMLDWPANSPDLNPIENLWGIVKRKMRDTRPNNADDLKAAYQRYLGFHTTSAVPQKLITSMHAELRQ